MDQPNRLRLLRRVLLIKVFVTLFVWGLPSLVAPPALSAMLGITFPEDPVFLRLFGAIVTAAALLYWYAYRDPLRNVAIIKFGVLDNGLGSITIAVLAMTSGIESWFLWVSFALLSFFCAAFALLMPRQPAPAAEG